MGIVAISAMQAALAAAATFLRKNLAADSPSYLCTFIMRYLLFNQIELKHKDVIGILNVLVNDMFNMQ